MIRLVSTQRQFGRSAMLRWLDEVGAASEPAATLYLPPGQPASEIEAALAGALHLGEPAPELVKAVGRSPTGAVVFWGEQHRCSVLPPFPIPERRASAGYDVGPLRVLLANDLVLALVLVRLAGYAIGVFQGEKLVSSKVGTGNVHSRHKNGGWSQHRFERHREKQMEYLFERVCLHMREHLEPHIQRLSYVVYGGERNTLLAFRKGCPFAQRVADRTLDRTLNVREPRQDALQAAIREAWSSRVTEWREDRSSAP
ncbi:MAG: hypothetical protein M1370_00030 [Bacteroidetes bacterium]|nr:hypothetical protein [Bacteroidota bacterium]MCL5025373.1 hypothetical protein [Chloroflexota bacterium]